MCNGESGRMSEGGTIAILKPNLSSSIANSQPLLELALKLRNSVCNSSTMATIVGSPFTANESQYLDFIIHRDGDLSSNCQLRCLDNEAVLHRFRLPARMPSSMLHRLERQIDLGVGGEGVIGRRVSLIDDCGQIVGNGIMGWN